MPDLLITCRGVAASKAEQRLEGGPRLPATVGPEDELIEVDLELGTADSVVSAHKPALEVADHPVSKRNDGLGALPQPDTDRLGSRDVPVTGRGWLHEERQ